MNHPLPLHCSPPDAETARCLEQICTDFCWLVDQGFADQTAHLFTEDVWYGAQGQVSQGLTEVMRRMAERAARRDPLTRHVASGFRFHRLGPDEVQGQCVMVVYRGHATPALVADVHDVFRRQGNGPWKLAQRCMVKVLEGTAQMAERGT